MRAGRTVRGMSRTGGAGFALAVGLSSVFNFGFHAVASRLLSVADYGGLAAILAVMTAASVPIGAAQTALTRAAAQVLAEGGVPSGRRLLLQALPMSVALAGAVMICAPMTSRFLNLPGSAPIALTGVWLGVVFIESVAKALLVAGLHHRPVARSLIVSAVIRIAAVVALTPVAGLSAAIAATVIGESVAMGILLHSAMRRGLLAPQHRPIRVTWPDAGRALSAQVSLWLLASLAVLIGRRTLAPSASGSFAAMVTAAGSCVFLPQAVATMVFPKFVADGSVRLLLKAAGLAAGVGIACAAILNVDPVRLFGLMFGPDYRPDRLVFALLCLHFVQLGCMTVLAQYLVARRHAGVLGIWIALGTAGALGLRYGDSPRTIAVSVLLPTMVVTGFVAMRAVTAQRAYLHLDEGGLLADAPPIAASVPAPAPTALWAPALRDVTVVVPTYNGGDQLRPCIEELCSVLDAGGRTYEVLVMVDGSTDGSDLTVDGLHPAVSVHRSPHNAGKGDALRRGFSRSTGASVGFIDGDGDISPRVLMDLFAALDRSTAWVAVASKNIPGASVSATTGRRVMSVAYRMLVHWLFDLEVTDTQCGCKAFRREFLARSLGLTRERGFALDLELLSVGSRLGMREAIEVPVVLRRGTLGTISRRSVRRMLLDTYRIHRRLPQSTWASLPLRAPAPVGGELSSPLLP